jgi:hypothetical protein
MTNKIEFLTGKDYPYLCQSCQRIIDNMAEYLRHYGPDTDDTEEPIMLVYDRRLFCGGHYCKESGEEY